MKRRLANFQFTARHGYWFNVSTLILMIALWIAANIFGWTKSVIFVSQVSMLALVLAPISGVFASRVEVKQEDDANVQDVLDVVESVVDPAPETAA